MSGGIYGGDEIGAIVFDFGCNSIRAGFAGEDTPKADIPSGVGVFGNCSDVITDSAVREHEDDTEATVKQNTFYIGTNRVHLPKPGMHINNPIKDGMIHDWEVFEEVLQHLYNYTIQSESAYHPVVMSEAAWNTRANREKLTELLFEKYSIPAFYLVKSPVLAAFAHGRTSGVVLDSGSEQTSAVPIHEGYVLKNAIVRTPLGGEFITKQCKEFFAQSSTEVVPLYCVASKEQVSEGEKPVWKKKPNLDVTASFHDYMVREVLQDFAASVLQVNTETHYDQDSIAQLPKVSYDFPNGYSSSFGEERFRLAEGLFDTSMISFPDAITCSGGGGGGHAPVSMSAAVQNAVNICDIDIRASLFGNVIVTGGNSLILGFTERLNKDLSSRMPSSSVKLKVVSNSGTAERRFSSWVGGSILGSLGSFHQLWISKQEFEETGRNIIEKKCP